MVASDGRASRAEPALAGQRRLLEELGGTYREIVGDRVPAALVDFAHSEMATQMVIGASRRGHGREVLHGAVVNAVIRHADGFDVHVVAPTHEDDEVVVPAGPRPRFRRRRRGSISRRRQILGAILAVTVLPVLTVVLAAARETITLPTDLLLFLAASVGIALVGGVVVGVAAAVGASLLVNWFFVPPFHTFTISDPENVIALAIFVAAAAGASILVDRVATRRREALQARAEARMLAHTSGILIGEPDPVPGLLDQLRTTFSIEAVSLLSNGDDGWTIDASSGPDPPSAPSDGERWDLTADGTTILVLRDAHLSADDQRVLRTFLSSLLLALQSRRLQAEAAVAARLTEADQLRTALLQAVSHDLRTPLASIKASATSLLQPDVAWEPEQRRQFAETIDVEADRLNRLVSNLLDMSRLNAGVMTVAARPVYLEDVVAAALGSLDHDPSQVSVSVPETLAPVSVDAALLERALANIVANALAWSPSAGSVRIEGAEVGDRVHLRVIDRGPGVDPADRERVFQPFQRLGDHSTLAGVGLGLAVARGFIEATGGRVELDDTPGGGLTVLIDLPIAGDDAGA